MFENYSEYEKEKVRLFLKYVAYAASRHVKKQKREQELGIDDNYTKSALIYTKQQILDNMTYSQVLKQRLSNIDENRKLELDNKISAHYFNNQFLPYENKLKKLKAKYTRLKKKKVKDKAKLKRVKSKIESCDLLLKKLKKAKMNLIAN